MKFKTHQYFKHWTDTSSGSAAPEAVEAAKNARSQVERLLSGILLSENLVVLTGLGTSLCLKDSTGKTSIAPSMTDLWNAIESATPNFLSLLERVRQPKLPSGQWLLDLEELLSRCQMVLEFDGDPVVATFVKASESIIVKSCDFLGLLPPGTGLPVHEAFLRKISRRSSRLPRAKLFTTNYDLCFEEAASRAGFTLIDGFSHTMPQSFDGNAFSFDLVRREGESDVPTYASNVLQFHKLHGSIDWNRENSGEIRRSSNPSNPVLIYPKSGKFKSSFEQPYFEMMARFQSAVRMPNVGVLIVGFGFNDSHLVGPLASAIRGNSSLKLIAVGPRYESEMPPIVAELQSLIENGDRRISLLASDFETLVGSIPDLSAPSEDELHMARTKNIGVK